MSESFGMQSRPILSSSKELKEDLCVDRHEVILYNKTNDQQQ